MAAMEDKCKLQNMDGIQEEMEDETCKEIIPGYTSVEEFTKNGFKTLIEGIRHSNSLPQGSDWNFYNTHNSFTDIVNSEGNKILTLINNIFKHQGVKGNIKNRDQEEKIELIIEANDMILERVANNLDELAGIRKNPEIPVEIQTVSAELPINGSWNRMNQAKFSIGSSLQSSAQTSNKSTKSIRLLTAKNIPRPQTAFKDRVDNSRSPWEPRIKDKPNSLKPLAIYLEETEDRLGEIFCHPYEFELDRFEPQADQLTYIEPNIPKRLSETPLHIVEEPEQLHALVEDLRNYKEIAVDVEHHSYRTFLGITCLLQISTDDNDYLIDTLKLRDKLHILNEIFTRPTIVKIFHGADNDVEWLQRDLSLYVVNMFDTHQAAKQLSYAQLSLAYLLKKFCQIDADKHFQLADWRLRPLPEELKTYAREDTHYLIYIYHLLRNTLLDSGNGDTRILKAVIQTSTNICKKRYVKPVLHDDSHLELYRKCKKLFDNRQLFALKELYKWRDEMARNEDESTGYVIPNHMLLQISELLPREMQGVLACCNPIPPLVRANLLELHKIILRAREQSVTKPIFSAETRTRGNTQHHSKLNTDSVLNCPHDLSVIEEFRDDLPTLLGHILDEYDQESSSYTGSNKKQNKAPSTTPTDYNTFMIVECTDASLNIFETPENSDEELSCAAEIKLKMQNLKFLGPYERYKMVKPYIQAEDEKNLPSETQTQQSQQERTDEERIAALQQHFKAVAATTAQIMPVPNSDKTIDEVPECLPKDLRGKKRKRDFYNFTKNLETSNLDLPPEKLLTEDMIVNDNPNEQKPKNNKNKNKLKNKKKNNNKNKNYNQQQFPQSNQQFQSDSIYNNEYEMNRMNYNNCKQQSFQNTNKQWKQRGTKRKFNDNSGNNFKPFDYGSVDFTQFQGGGGNVNKANNVKSKFKSKGQKNKKFQNIGRQNMKSSTFDGFNTGNNPGSRSSIQPTKFLI